MQTQDAGKVIARIGSCWPRPPLDPPTIAVWLEHLEKRDSLETAIAACRILERSSRRLPSLSDFLEAYDEARHATPSKLLGKPDCGICLDGFIDVPCDRRYCDCQSPNHTVRECPNGCKPMSHEERNARARRDDEIYQRVQHERRMDRRVDVPIPDLRQHTDSAARREAEEPF